MENNSYKQQWENFLNPDIFKDRLINISMYITAYEMLKDTIINRIKDFYILPFAEHDHSGELSYKERVLSRNKNHLYASLDWLNEYNVIDENDKHTIDGLKEYRNYLAHEMSNIVFSGEIEALFDKFVSVYQLIHKIEKWWIINFELEVNCMHEDIDLKNIDYDGIQSGKTIMLDMALNVLSGNEELLKKFKEGQV